VLSRFLPIVRTYIPFVAGMAQMPVLRYEAFNAAGAVAWVGALTYAGYFFGNIPWIRGNLTALIVAIVALSLAPLAVAFLRSRLRRRGA
jgi:membrane-associated protein